jgi:RecB family endonuclease NucS
MPIYEFGTNSINRLPETTFSSAGVHERRDLQRLLRGHIEVIAPDTLVIDEEFGDWEDSRLRIDLLAIDKNGKLVVVELKRTEDGGHMELQSIRYASMVSTLIFDRAVDFFARYLKKIGKEDQDARMAILDFLEWDEPDDDRFA